MKTSIVFILLLFSINIFPQSKLYISQSGNDRNPGTYQRPFATINRAFKDIQPDTNDISGVTIYVLPGEYQQYVSINKSGRLNHPITIQAYDQKEKPVFYGNDAAVFAKKDAVFRWGGQTDFTILDGIILRDVTASDNMRGIWMRGDHNIIRNCELYKIKRTGIVVQGSYNIIEHNVVDGIIGGSNHKYRGNSISIESYYKAPDIRINCEYNLIQYNHFINNLTHVGINIFPATDDPRQPLMKGNKIYYNYVANIGAAVYVRYQVNLEIIGNVFVHSVQDTSYGSPGGAITFDQNRKMNPYPVPYDGGIIKIYKNTIANNTDYGIKNYNVNALDLKNNIFIDSLSSNPKYLYLSFSYSAKDIKADVDSNSYYGNGWWRWGIGTNQKIFDDWIKVSGQDKHGKYFP